MIGSERAPRALYADRTIRLGVYKRYLFIAFRSGDATVAADCKYHTLYPQHPHCFNVTNVVNMHSNIEYSSGAS